MADKANTMPLNAIFADDVVELLVPVTTTDTIAEVAEKVAYHVEGRRVRARNLPKAVFHDGRELSRELTVAEAGIQPRDHIRVDYEEQG
jgi:toluene monooxygenase system protein B